jgi:hypothetical protein
MKIAGWSVLLTFSFAVIGRADLTIVQKVEGEGAPSQMTIKIKGEKARLDISPQISTIIDSKTGEMVSLMNDQKAVVRISAEKMKAAAEAASKFGDKKEAAGPAKLTPTGKKETVSGYETEQYTYEAPSFKATYWIATKYPDAAGILKQLQALNSQAWNSGMAKLPDYRDFPGMPIKTEVSAGENRKITSTIISVKQDPVSDADFSVPKDFQEIKAPDMSGMGAAKPNTPAEASSPQP